ncbi:S8 family serine peptidase [Kangiella sediminilitoris]|uniref:Peptidase S8 n=1 Tax=Kangiella sediminilitoris TaxID=1144748 RepID=A0A1B3BAK1_9GAMM|nr:S8 family serine peptidase [Kangiella sediminilitoris]AOE49825.1 peptidase S8 [Kangiella sediminilitoris]
MKTQSFFKSKPVQGALLAAGIGLSSFGLSAKSLGPHLSETLPNALDSEQFEVIITFEGDGPASEVQINALESLGINRGVMLQNVPMIGTVATKQQIESIYARDDVRSVWHNSELTYDNKEATQLTGVDRLRADQSIRLNGVPVSGKGIGVVVNDSGVDGTHSDLKYPNHVVQNVLAQTNLNSIDTMLPITYQEDVANTDLAGGHGTHVAGTIGGNGSMSSGEQEGVAPGADIIGYGSGAGLFILDTLGGFDYALTHQFEYNIRVISNSFGSTGDTGTDFNPDHPTNILTKKLSDNGVIVVFSAGNSGSGEATITGNFKKAPWVVTVAAGDKAGNLADFSSRGVKGGGGTVEVDGETFEWVDRPTITAPGVDIVSARASLGSTSLLSTADDAEVLPADQVPYYTLSSGTSMSAPHISGIVALMLEANPSLNWRDVKRILQETATNMPGLEPWEAGAGYVNAYAAVQAALDEAKDFGQTTKLNRDFNASANTSVADEFQVDVDYAPAGDNPGQTFIVDENVSLIMARSNVGDNTVAIVLTSPSGKRYGSSISLPVLGQNIAVTAPGEAGTWSVSVSGIGGVSGVDLDPVGVTNGYAVPDTIPVDVKFVQVDGFTGIDDVAGHPAQSFIEYAVSEQLVDALADGFAPDAVISRAQFADFLTLAAGIRQSNDAADSKFIDVSSNVAAINAVTDTGSALKDTAQQQSPVMTSGNSTFNPEGAVTKLSAAYSLVQALGLEGVESSYSSGYLTAIYGDERVMVADAGNIPEDLKHYVQHALDLGLINARFEINQGPFDLEPTITAYFEPGKPMTRAGAAVALTRLFSSY